MLIPVASPATFPALGSLPEPLSDADVAGLKKLGVAGPMYLSLPTAARLSEQTIKALKPLLNAVPCCVGPFGPGEDNAAASYLDAGTVHVVFDVDVSLTADSTPAGDGGDAAAGAGAAAAAGTAKPSVAAIAETIASLSPGRVFVRLRGIPLSTAGAVPTELAAAITALRMYCSGMIIEVAGASIPGETLKHLRAMASNHVRVMAEAAADAPAFKSADVSRLHRHEVSALALTVSAPNDEAVAQAEAAGKLDVGTCLASCVRSDRPDGLFTTVVQDETGHTLGLVYSSKESVLEAIRAGRGVYYSRSRGGLWRKGDTSGNYQLLRYVRVDCDSDALLFNVQQMGSLPAFCHLNTRSCWGDDGGLSALERTLQSRKVDAPAGSYTKRLFDDHELLRAKLLEEAQELGEAVEPDHVAAEAADLLYFALVACVKAGVSIADVESHLDRRALKVRRRPGDAKPARIAAAKAHFDALNASKKAEAAAAPASAAGGAAATGEGAAAPAGGADAAAAPAAAEGTEAAAAT